MQTAYAQLMPLPLTVSCSSKIQIGFTFLVPAYPGCSGKEAVKWLLLFCQSFEIELIDLNFISHYKLLIFVKNFLFALCTFILSVGMLCTAYLYVNDLLTEICFVSGAYVHCVETMKVGTFDRRRRRASADDTLFLSVASATAGAVYAVRLYVLLRSESMKQVDLRPVPQYLRSRFSRCTIL